MRVESGAYRCPADRQIVETTQHLLQALNVASEQSRPTAKFLSDRQGNCILQMRTADLDHVLEFASLRRDRLAHGFDRWNQCILHSLRRGDMHRRRKSI